MSQTGRYAVIYWKGLKNDNVLVKEFNDEQEMVDFAETQKIRRYGVLVGEITSVGKNGEKTFKVRNYGAYPIFKRWYKYFGLFLIGLIIFLILSWK